MRSTRAFPHELKTTQVSNTLKIFAVLPVRSLAKRCERGPRTNWFLRKTADPSQIPNGGV